MGLVFHIISVFDGLTVEENLLLGALPKDPREAGHPVDEIEMKKVIDLVDLGALRDRTAGQLGHGEKQRLEMGMVLLTRPTLLLLDEPTSGMTEAESRRTAGLLQTLRREGEIEAAIVVEHNIEFIRLVADRVTVMHRGGVLADGRIEQVQDDPAVQASFLGRLQ
jgi:ABC-type uncharacterized transport system ATPase subunit